jgi:hypothetical protein
MKPDHICQHLRTKKMYITALAHEAFTEGTDENAHSAPCWCNKTMSETGPDDRVVGARVCSRSRSCFEE